MSTPVEGHDAAGLVAAYGFEAGQGQTVVDASRHENAGAIRGAQWTSAGRLGGGMSFEGTGQVIRVPASATLDLKDAMTLAAWIKPSEPQDGWRTVVARQPDAYGLVAGGGRQNAAGLHNLDILRFVLVILLGGWVGLGLVGGHSLWGPGERHWYQPVALFICGSLVDVALRPSNALIGPALVALWWGATSDELQEKSTLYGLAGAFAAVTVLSIVDPNTTLLPYNNGGVVRAAALGALLVAGSVLDLQRCWRASATAARALV